MKSVELSKFDSDHYISDYMYGKEDYLYTEFCDFLPDWVKADRIIRKQLKEKTDPPIVPKSSFDPLHHLAQPEPTPVKEPIVEERPAVEIKRKLVEVLDDSSAVEVKPERLDGTPCYPSLLIQPLPAEVKEKAPPSDLPFIQKKTENVIDTMKSRIASTVLHSISIQL